MRRSICISIALLLASMLVPMSALVLEQPQENVVRVAQPRPFGYVIGDVITQRILLPRQFEPVSLSTQRVSIWFERRGSKIETADGQRWLRVDYQVVNAPQALASVTLPAWELASEDGARLSVPAGAISIGTLIPASASVSSLESRADRPAPSVPTAGTRSRLHLALLVLAVTLVAWLAWFVWRDARERANLPFAHALHELRKLGDQTPQSWQALHRAFDHTAGRVIQLETLPALFQRAPHLEPLRNEIERFYAQSSARFFGSGLREEPVSPHALCRELRRLEKGHAR
jgi:mxaA protein